MAKVPGLKLLKDFISEEEEKDLLQAIDKHEWQGDGKGKRRIQQYGAIYDFDKHEVKRMDENKVAGFPDFFKPYLERISPFLSKPVQQAFVNEYVHHQGIAPHIDNPDDFGPEIISLSLNAPTVIVFANLEKTEQHHVLIPPRALLIMTGKARYEWTHEIPYSKIVRWEDGAETFVYRRPNNYRRISITFRALTSSTTTTTA